jgi:lipid-A-disaccharide synthase-like uncharacterized protein
MTGEQFWLSVGFLAQAFFSMRFIVQWLVSERRRHSVIPIAFWVLSVCGGLTLLTYALHRRDPVFAAGELVGTLIYLRNLQFARRARSRREPAAGTAWSSGVGRDVRHRSAGDERSPAAR